MPPSARAVTATAGPCAVSPTGCSGSHVSCCSGRCYSTPTTARQQRRRSERSLSSTGPDILSSRPTLGRAPRASAVQEAAQRHWRKPARSVLDSGSTVLHSTGREGPLHASPQRCFAKHYNLISSRKSHQQAKEPPVRQQHMADITVLAEAEIAPGGLVELIDMAQSYKVGAPRPGIQGLQ